MQNIIIFIIITLFSVSLLSAEEVSFTQINLRLAKDFGTSNLPFPAEGVDRPGSYIEIESIAARGDFELYGFTDIRYGTRKETGEKGLNIDFYKYHVGYDVLGNDLLFVRAELKETYDDGKGDSFEGIGTRIPIPKFGNLDVTLYYYNGANSNNFSVDNPYSLQFSWYNVLYNINNDWNVAHSGWADYDFFTKSESTAEQDSAASLQLQETLSLNYKNSYAIEVGYKYWHHAYGNDDWKAHTGYVALVKNF